MIQAIVYTSNAGTTERYAKLLGHETDLSVYSLEEAKKTVKNGTEIIYLARGLSRIILPEHPLVGSFIGFM